MGKQKASTKIELPPQDNILNKNNPDESITVIPNISEENYYRVLNTELILDKVNRKYRDLLIITSEHIKKFIKKIDSNIEDNRFLEINNKIIKNKRKNVLVLIDFSEYQKYETAFDLDFFGLKKMNLLENNPLSVLRYSWSCLSEEGAAIIVPININHNNKIINRFVRCTNFKISKQINNEIHAVKRNLMEYAFDRDRLIFKEANDMKEIGLIQDFAKSLLTKYNFNFSIDSLFIPYSDFFYCFRKETNEIVSFLRYSWYLPKHPLPCMLAKIKGTTNAIVLEKPEDYSYGEIFSPFVNSLTGAKAYKELTKNIIRHCIEQNENNIVFTTYDMKEPKSGGFFKDVFGFQDSGHILKYGDFGGDWGLIKGSEEQIIPIASRFLK